MKLANRIWHLLPSNYIAIAAIFFYVQAIDNRANAAQFNEKQNSSERDAQVLLTHDWVLLNSYDTEGQETSNLMAAGSGSPKLSFLKEGALVVERPCASVSAEYRITESNTLTVRGYSIAGSFCAAGASWSVERLNIALSHLQSFQILPNKNTFKVRLLLHFVDGSQWILAPTNKLLILD